MSFKLKRFTISAIIAICIFAMVISGCTNEPMIEVEPVEPIETESVEEVVMDVVEPTEPIVVEEVVEETKPKEVVEEPEKKPEKVDNSNKATEKPKKESSDSNLVSLGKFKLTAYCGCKSCCNKTDGITATGTKAKQGRTIAVDPSVIPYGTKVVINGHTYVAEDCGGAIDGNRIDIYMSSHKEALQFGVQYATVYKVVS